MGEMSYQTGPTTTVRRLYGLRWDFNPAIYGVGKLAKGNRMFGSLERLQLGPGGIIRIKVSTLNGILAIFNTYINFDLLVGQDESGEWAAYLRVGVGVGQEANAAGIFDTLEDYFSAVIPALNLIPTPIAWADQTVPVNAFDIFADSSAWAGISAAFSDAPTAGSPTFGAIAGGFCTIKLASVDFGDDD